jgi:hypothetical protein
MQVEQDALRKHPVVGDDEKYPRRKPKCRHNKLRQVMITGFCSAKSLVDLTVHILEGASLLERLTLDTTRGCSKSSRFPASVRTGQCLPMSKTALTEAHKAIEVAGRYIAGRVPTSGGLSFLNLCIQNFDVQKKNS